MQSVNDSYLEFFFFGEDKAGVPKASGEIAIQAPHAAHTERNLLLERCC
jgi:hypothetical protein